MNPPPKASSENSADSRATIPLRPAEPEPAPDPVVGRAGGASMASTAGADDEHDQADHEADARVADDDRAVGVDGGPAAVDQRPG